MSIINIGTYPPKQCGIATFSMDLRKSLLKSGLQVSAAAVSDQEYHYQYGAEVILNIRQHEKNDYFRAADQINTNSLIDLVIIQHEYGIYGGEAGCFLLDLCANLEKPFILITHTVLPEPSETRRQVLTDLTRMAAGVVCMTEGSARLLQSVYQVPPAKIRTIGHGVPDFIPQSQTLLKQKFGVEKHQIITTFGLIGPGKGLELGIRAVSEVLREYPGCLYLILGQTHPMLQKTEGERYRNMLEGLVRDLGIEKNVHWVNRYLSDEELGEYLYLTDIYLSPYPNLDQAVSGTLTFAVGCGRAIVSTAYAHAVELLSDDRGLLACHPDSHELAQLCKAILGDPELKMVLQTNAARLGQSMSWNQIGLRYRAFIEDLLRVNGQERIRFNYA